MNQLKMNKKNNKVTTVATRNISYRLIKTFSKLNLAIRSKLSQKRKGEFGMSAIIGIAIGLIIAAFVLLPGIRGFAQTIITDMEKWWSNSISNQVFSS